MSLRPVLTSLKLETRQWVLSSKKLVEPALSRGNGSQNRSENHQPTALTVGPDVVFDRCYVMFVSPPGS